MLKTKLILTLSVMLFAGVACIALGPSKVYAAIEEPCPDGHTVRFNPGSDGPTFSELCADHQTGGSTADSKELTQPIPAGCPGSANPTQPPPAECAQIPLGCPGSTQQGPIASPPDNCPYSANAVNNSNNGISDAGGDCRGNLEPDNCNITKYIKIFTNILAVLVGVIVAIMIVVGGIQYSMSRDNPQATAAAKSRITNAVIALVVYIFATAILQYLIPGGLF